jgi:hypothetical protein
MGLVVKLFDCIVPVRHLYYSRIEQRLFLTIALKKTADENATGGVVDWLLYALNYLPNHLTA